jgi:hypothetical protein
MLLRTASQYKNFLAKPLLGKFYWKRIDILDGVNPSSTLLKNAEAAAKSHPLPELPAFAFTEANPRWVLLYDLSRKGQITPQIMRNMKRADLYFLAGHIFPHPGLNQPKQSKSLSWWDNEEFKWEQGTKLQGNATRAKNELDRRNFIWTSLFVIIAALAGGLLGSGIWK